MPFSSELAQRANAGVTLQFENPLSILGGLSFLT